MRAFVITMCTMSGLSSLLYAIPIMLGKYPRERVTVKSPGYDLGCVLFNLGLTIWALYLLSQ